MAKKTLITLLIIFLLVLAGGGFYWFYQRQPAPGAGVTAPGPVFPRGTGETPPPGTPTGAPTITPGPAGELPAPAAGPAEFQLVWSKPVRDFALTSGVDSRLLFLEQATGNVYQLALTATATPERLTNTTLPRVGNVWWGKDGRGERVILEFDDAGRRRLDAGLIKPPAITATASAVGELVTTELPSTVSQLAVSPDGQQLFYLDKISGGGATASLADFDLLKPTVVARLAFGDWTANWLDRQTVALTAKPSGRVGGLTYFLNLQTKSFRKHFGPINGLVINPSPDGKKILFQQAAAGTVGLFLETAAVPNQDLQTQTLADKCVWAKDGINLYCAVPRDFPAGVYPDDWYSGAVSFNDALWQINTLTNQGRLIFDPRAAGLASQFDFAKLLIAGGERQLFLGNKFDGSLWRFNLTTGF